MDEVVLDGENGRTLTLRRLSSRDVEGIWKYEATLSIPAASATSEVYDLGDRLGPFFRELADAWKGFDGEKEYGSLEGQLHLSCTHDGVGTVSCVVTLRQPWPPDWRLEAVVQFGAGAHLDRLASDVESLISASA